MTARHWIRIVGAVLVMFGALCLPNAGRSPRSYGSVFFNLSDTGSLLWIGAAFFATGALVFLASFVRGK